MLDYVNLEVIVIRNTWMLFTFLSFAVCQHTGDEDVTLHQHAE